MNHLVPCALLACLASQLTEPGSSSELSATTLCEAFAHPSTGVSRFGLEYLGATGFDANSRLVKFGVEQTEADSSPEPEILWSGSLSATTYGSAALAVGLRNDDCIAIAATIHGGAYRNIMYWWLDEAADGGGLCSGELTKVELSNVFQRGTETPIVHQDIFDPEFVAWNGGLALVGASRAYSTGDNPWLTDEEVQNGWARHKDNTVWIARADLASEGVLEYEGHRIMKSRSLVARAVTSGVSPRLIRQGDTMILAVRAPDTLIELRQHSRVRFYRSNDLIEWTEDVGLSGRVTAAPNYSIALTSSGLVLATTSEGQEPCIVAWGYDESSASWQLDEQLAQQGHRVRSALDRVWVFGATAPVAEQDEVIIYKALEGERATILL